MIETRAKALVSHIERQRELRKHLHLLDGFKSQSVEVAAARKRLEGLVTIWNLFRDRRIRLPNLPQGIGGVVKEAELLRERFTADPAYVLGANRLAVVKTGVPALASSLEQGLLGSWQAYAFECIPKINIETLLVLEKIGPLRAQVDRVSRGLRSLTELANILPRTAKAIDEFAKGAADVNQSWNQLDSDHLRPDVLRFLKDAGSPSGAELNLLTEAVRQWLQDHDLEKAFRIRSSPTTNF